MERTYIGIFVITLVCIGLTHAVSDYSGLPVGPYCAALPRGCCNGREDDCAAPIIGRDLCFYRIQCWQSVFNLGTLCYCDDFCNRTRSEDCCPDFLSFCKGIVVSEPIKACTYQGQYFAYGKTAKQNCNIWWAGLPAPTKTLNIDFTQFFFQQMRKRGRQGRDVVREQGLPSGREDHRYGERDERPFRMDRAKLFPVLGERFGRRHKIKVIYLTLRIHNIGLQI